MKVVIIDGRIEKVQFEEDPIPTDFDYNKLQGRPAETKEDIAALIAGLKKDFTSAPAETIIPFSKTDLDDITATIEEIEPK